MREVESSTKTRYSRFDLVFRSFFKFDSTFDSTSSVWHSHAPSSANGDNMLPYLFTPITQGVLTLPLLSGTSTPLGARSREHGYRKDWGEKDAFPSCPDVVHIPGKWRVPSS